MNAMTQQDLDALGQQTIEALRAKIDPIFQKTKGHLFYQKGAGFLGSLLCKISFGWTRDISTAAISTTKLYWNPDFFLSLDKETRVTVLAHELWHNGMMHSARLGERCPDIWNIAGDHVINNLLKDHDFYMGGFPYLMDPKYKGWSTDEVYDDLISPNGGGMKPFSNTVTIGTLGKDIMPAEAMDKDIAIANVVGAMTVARMSKQAGDVPGEIVQIIDEFLNPKLPWEVIFFNFFNALTSEEYSHARPNRRYEDPQLPGLTGRNGLEHLVYMVDASGSMDDDQVLRANSEVKFIQEELRPERLTLIIFDTEIRNIYEYETDDPFGKIEIHGRGGTDLKDCWDYLLKERPTAAVVFTDACVDIPENPGIPIVWLVLENPDTDLPYGQVVHFSEAAGYSFGRA